MWRAVLTLWLAGCGSVLLGEEQRPAQDAGGGSDAAPLPDAASASDAGTPLTVSVWIRSTDCGTCFELQAEGFGGRPPYDFEWEDGLSRVVRRVCVGDGDVMLSVVALDAAAARSQPQAIQLQAQEDGGCSEPVAPPEPAPTAELCLQNPSFEGTAAPNLGQDQAFDATPWSSCTNPTIANTPDIGNDMIAATPGVPKPMDGLTFLGLAEGEQVSQAVCSPFADGATTSFQLDLARIDLGAELTPDTEQVFLEVWGGLSVDCSQRELLWASPALRPGWQRHCVTLRPRAFMTQLTLRANADMTQPSTAYLLVDNLTPVDDCP